MKQLISIIAPMYNEENIVSEYCKVVKDALSSIENTYDYEVLLINDGSKDKTLDKMYLEQKNDPQHFSIVSLSRNFGLEGAIQAGLRKASGDFIVTMDADLQDSPFVILDLIKKAEEGFDVVVANRKKRVNDTWFKRISAKIYYKILDDLSGKIHLEPGAANFRLLSRKALCQLKELPEVNGVYRVIVPFIGMKTTVIEYEREKRYAGKTKYNLKSMTRYALDSITGISIEPLRKIFWFIILSGLFFLGNLVGFLISTAEWKSIFYLGGIISILFICLFLVLALIGEYIAQIMTETKGRPISIIDEYIPSQNSTELQK